MRCVEWSLLSQCEEMITVSWLQGLVSLKKFLLFLKFLHISNLFNISSALSFEKFINDIDATDIDNVKVL